MEIKNIFKIIFLKFIFENSTKILIQLSSYRFHTNTITEKRIATITTATITIMRSRFLLWARSSWLETSASFEWESCESKIRFWTIILTLKMNWIILYLISLYQYINKYSKLTSRNTKSIGVYYSKAVLRIIFIFICSVFYTSTSFRTFPWAI